MKYSSMFREAGIDVDDSASDDRATYGHTGDLRFRALDYDEAHKSFHQLNITVESEFDRWANSADFVADLPKSAEHLRRIVEAVRERISAGGRARRRFRSGSPGRCSGGKEDLDRFCRDGITYLPFSYVYDVKHSGAVLAWKYFMKDRFPDDVAAPEILRCIEDGDLWKWEMPQNREVLAALDSYGVRGDFRQLVKVCRAESGQLGAWQSDIVGRLAEEGAAILRARSAMVDLICKSAGTVVFEGFHCYAANSSVLQSEIGNKLAEQPASVGCAPPVGGVPLAIVWYYDGKDRVYRVSLRSVGDFDVSALAKRFKGGGDHRNAAGFECSKLPWM